MRGSLGKLRRASFQLGQCAVVVAQAVIQIVRPREMRFASIWPQPSCRLKSRFRQGKPGRCMVAYTEYAATVSIDQLVVGFEKGRVSCNGLIKKLNRLLQVLLS